MQATLIKILPFRMDSKTTNYRTFISVSGTELWQLIPVQFKKIESIDNFTIKIKRCPTNRSRHTPRSNDVETIVSTSFRREIHVV